MFFNGEIVHYADAKVGLLTHGLNYGTGVFEGIRAYWNPEREQLFALSLPEHFERMHQNTRTLQMTIPWSVDELVAIGPHHQRLEADIDPLARPDRGPADTPCAHAFLRP